MRLIKILMTLVIGLSLAGSSTIASAKPAKTSADHMAMAEKYEKLAADQEAVVAEHEQMKKDKKKIQATIQKQFREKAIAEMEDHCNTIIVDAQKLADEYKAMAQWHKMRAEEMGK